MGELVAAGDVAGGIDMAVVGAHAAVDADAAAIVFQADRVQPQGGGVGDPSLGQENRLCLQGGPAAVFVLDGDPRPAVRLACVDHGGVEVEAHPLSGQLCHDQVRHVAVFLAQDLAGTLDHIDPAPQAAEGLRHLHGNGAGAEDDHGGGQGGQGEEIAVGEAGDPLEEGLPRRRRRRAGGDDPGAGGETFAVQQDAVLVGEFGAAEADLGPQPAEPLHRVMFLDAGDDLPDAGRDPAEIHRPHLRRRQAVAIGPADGMAEAGGPDQGLAGHAAGVQTVAAQGGILFDEQGAGPEPCRAGGDGQAGRAAADDADVIVMGCHGLSPLLRRHRRRNGSCRHSWHGTWRGRHGA